MLSFWRNHMHQSTVAKKNHAENQATFPGVYAIFTPGFSPEHNLDLLHSFQTNSVPLS